MNKFKIDLAEVFHDTHKHKEVAGIIARHLTNKCDVREEALNGLQLKHLKHILDLGCGFGFFTRALGGKLASDAVVTGIDRHPGYEKLYLETCREAGIEGKFIGRGISVLEEIPDNSVELVICSYAMYFFPWIVPEVRKKLKRYAYFIIITHAIPHMGEFTEYIRSILKKHHVKASGQFPYEKLIGLFSNRNACEYLDPYFNKIIRKRYTSSFLFETNDYEDFVKYFRFKHRFFIPENASSDLEDIILETVKDDLNNGKVLEITKDDMIFVCSHPQDKSKIL